ncbi:SDR family oxidoreductase [Rhizobium lentis]|uniref:SDR family oxidoreductase n=1 Tax=Rhizobium lentis TaxID=1138194 RepID=UPI001C836C29|nr:SDR family oxidoreductase [Rhizobium lentis]MBX5133375.1 SDR family oxidoreductase [Rhizobium lentis]MBX5154083.1 SDR family oxidoreductase [Rhizobium lentis]
MKLGLENKVVLITGGSKGIGFACARLFGEEGATVVISSRSQVNIDGALERIPGAVGFAADVSSDADALNMIQSVEKQFGKIDVLVNSAGAAKRTAVADLTPAAWRAAMDAKYFTYINVIDPVIKLMAARKSGVVINIIGNGGKTASPLHLAGGAANAALMLATVGLATAYGDQGIRVIGLNPGFTETDRVTEGLKTDAKQNGITEAEARDAAIKRIPMGRMATPEEVAQVTVFLASEQASYVTGVNIGMDGGQTTTLV